MISTGNEDLLALKSRCSELDPLACPGHVGLRLSERTREWYASRNISPTEKRSGTVQVRPAITSVGGDARLGIPGPPVLAVGLK